MHPRTVWLIMMIWMAVVVGIGHYDNASQIGSVKWIVGVVAGLIFCGAYFKLKSAILNSILALFGLTLLLAGVLGKPELTDPSNKIFLSAFVLGSLLVMVWRAVQVEMAIRKAITTPPKSQN